MLTQIYEVQTPRPPMPSRPSVSIMSACWSAGAIFRARSALSQATVVGAAIRPGSKFCALFLGAEVALIERMAKALAPSILHLGAAPEKLSRDATAGLKQRAAGHCHHALHPGRR